MLADKISIITIFEKRNPQKSIFVKKAGKYADYSGGKKKS